MISDPFQPSKVKESPTGKQEAFNQAQTEFKDVINLKRYLYSSYLFKNEREEEFGDYVRIDPHLHFYFCYIHRSIDFQAPKYFGKPDELKNKIQEVFDVGIDINQFLSITSYISR